MPKSKPLVSPVLKKRPTPKYIPEEKIAEALIAAYGIHTKAAKLIGISQQALSERVSKSEYLQKMCEASLISYGDLLEDGLIELAKEKNITAIIFGLKTKFKNRGFVETNTNTSAHDALLAMAQVMSQMKVMQDQTQPSSNIDSSKTKAEQ